MDDYFAYVLEQNFPEFTWKTNVAWEGLKVPLSYLLMKDGQPVLGILIFDSHDPVYRHQAQKAKGILAAYGVGFTHFFREYRNEVSYVVDRIRLEMGDMPY